MPRPISRANPNSIEGIDWSTFSTSLKYAMPYVIMFYSLFKKTTINYLDRRDTRNFNKSPLEKYSNKIITYNNAL